MEVLVAILVIALIAAIAFAFMQRRPARVRGPVASARCRPVDEALGAMIRWLRRRPARPGHRSSEVREEEQRLRAQANRVAADLHHSQADDDRIR